MNVLYLELDLVLDFNCKCDNLARPVLLSILTILICYAYYVGAEYKKLKQC